MRYHAVSVWPHCAYSNIGAEVQQTNKQRNVTNKNKCHQQTNKSNFSATAAPLHWDLAQLYFPFISNTKIVELGNFLERNTAISPLYLGTVQKTNKQIDKQKQKMQQTNQQMQQTN